MCRTRDVPSLASRGIVWHSVASHGIPWHPVASHGIPWHPVASRGIPWHPVAFLEPLLSLSQGTSAILVNVNAYNGNLDAYIAVTILFELPQTGRIYSSMDVKVGLCMC